MRMQLREQTIDLENAQDRSIPKNVSRQPTRVTLLGCILLCFNPAVERAQHLFGSKVALNQFENASMEGSGWNHEASNAHFARSTRTNLNRLPSLKWPWRHLYLMVDLFLAEA